MTHATIPISYYCGDNLDTRNSAEDLFAHMRSFCATCGDIELDFSHIVFMSRAFADQFHKEKMQWHKECNVAIIIINESLEIKQIFKAVSNTQKKREARPSSIPFYSFTKMENVFSFLEKH